MEPTIPTIVAPTHINTVKENEKYYTPRQKERAKRARELLHTLGCGTVNDLKVIIKTNMIKNNPVTVDDVAIAEQIFGPDVGLLKGKTVRTRMPEARQGIVEIPKELIKIHKCVDLCIDIIKVCGLWFLTTISKNLMYRTAFWLPNKKVQTYRSVLDKTLRIYPKAHLRIKRIFTDNKF